MDINMNYNNNMTTLPKRGLKTSQYKELSKSQLIKLLLKQEAKKPIPPTITGKWESVKLKPVPRKSINEDIILPPPKGFQNRPPKPTRKSPQSPKPNYDFNFDDNIFQTENTSLGKFKIIRVQSRENKKFESYTNEFKVKILKKLDDVKGIYHIFQELVKTVKKRRKLSDNDMLRLIIQNEELPNAISTKFNKVENSN